MDNAGTEGKHAVDVALVDGRRGGSLAVVHHRRTLPVGHLDEDPGPSSGIDGDVVGGDTGAVQFEQQPTAQCVVADAADPGDTVTELSQSDGDVRLRPRHPQLEVGSGLDRLSTKGHKLSHRLANAHRIACSYP